VGEPITLSKRFNFLGVDAATGIYRIEDVNQDDIITSADRYIPKSIGQVYFGGLENTFQLKGLELTVHFQYVKQQGNVLINYNAPGTLSNQPEYVMGRWQTPDNTAEQQRFTTTGNASTAYGNYYYSNQTIKDASFVRLKNVSLSYSLPNDLLTKLHISGCRVLIQGQNLAIISSYDGISPESPGSTSLPPLNTITGGINITF
jgi:hypothetical protein